MNHKAKINSAHCRAETRRPFVNTFTPTQSHARSAAQGWTCDGTESGPKLMYGSKHAAITTAKGTLNWRGSSPSSASSNDRVERVKGHLPVRMFASDGHGWSENPEE